MLPVPLHEIELDFIPFKPVGDIRVHLGGLQAGRRARLGRRRSSAYFVVTPDRAELIALAQRIEAGVLRPIVGGVAPLAEGRAAFEIKRSGGGPGKMALKVAE